jgi:hypothetical protein
MLQLAGVLIVLVLVGVVAAVGLCCGIAFGVSIYRGRPMRLSRYFWRVLSWSLFIQALVWTVCFLHGFLSSEVYWVQKMLYFLYGGRIVEWYCQHHIAYTESNIGAGLFLFMPVIGVAATTYAFIIATTADCARQGSDTNR